MALEKLIDLANWFADSDPGKARLFADEPPQPSPASRSQSGRGPGRVGVLLIDLRPDGRREEARGSGARRAARLPRQRAARRQRAGFAGPPGDSNALARYDLNGLRSWLNRFKSRTTVRTERRKSPSGRQSPGRTLARPWSWSSSKKTVRSYSSLVEVVYQVGRSIRTRRWRSSRKSKASRPARTGPRRWAGWPWHWRTRPEAAAELIDKALTDLASTSSSPGFWRVSEGRALPRRGSLLAEAPSSIPDWKAWSAGCWRCDLLRAFPRSWAGTKCARRRPIAEADRPGHGAARSSIQAEAGTGSLPSHQVGRDPDRPPMMARQYLYATG